MFNVEVIAQDNNLCGEGPIWDARGGRLIWNDLSSSLVYQYSPQSGEKSVISTGIMAAGIALHEDGRLVFAGADGLHLWRGHDRFETIVTEHDGESLYFNDILACPAARLYAGTAYWGENGMEKYGKLYLVDTDRTVRVVDDGIEMSNGIGLSPDSRTLYFADSSARKIYAYDVQADGSLRGKRVFVTVPSTEGIPDGLTVDSDGGVWSAQWYGAQVVHYDPDGAVVERFAFPAGQTSSVAFGGADLTDLYVTSAADGWPSEYAPPGYDFAAPQGGSLFRVHTNSVGKLDHMVGIV